MKISEYNPPTQATNNNSSASMEMFISKLSSTMEYWKSGSHNNTYEELILPIIEHRERRARSPAVSSASGMYSTHGEDLYKRTPLTSIPLMNANKGLLNTNKRAPRLSVRALTEL